VNREDLGQAGDPKDLEDALLRADESQRAVVCPDALETADQDAEAGRVEELDALHVDDQVVVAGRHQVDELLPQLRRGVDIDLAAHDDDPVVALLTGREGQVHGSSWCVLSSADVA
jgi:hypothetical protein